MEVGLIIKIAGIGLLVGIVCQLLSKYGRDEQAVLVSIAGIVLVLLMLTDKLAALFTSIKSIFGL